MCLFIKLDVELSTDEIFMQWLDEKPEMNEAKKKLDKLLGNVCGN